MSEPKNRPPRAQLGDHPSLKKSWPETIHDSHPCSWNTVPNANPRRKRIGEEPSSQTASRSQTAENRYQNTEPPGYMEMLSYLQPPILEPHTTRFWLTWCHLRWLGHRYRSNSHWRRTPHKNRYVLNLGQLPKNTRSGCRRLSEKGWC